MYAKFRLTVVTLAMALSFSAVGPAIASPITVSDAGSGQITVNQGPVSTFFTGADITLNFSATTSGGLVIFNGPSNSLTINLGGGAPNSLTVASLPGSFAAPNFFMNGNTGNDAFIINTLFSGLYTVAGGGGTNTLNVSGLGLSLVDTGSTILNGSTIIISYSGISTVIGASRIPEPAALALFGIGLAGLGFARRRKPASQ